MHGAAPHALTGSSAGRRLDKKRLTRSAGKPGRNLFRSAFSPCVFPELRARPTRDDTGTHAHSAPLPYAKVCVLW